jgi:hypothetical protein
MTHSHLTMVEVDEVIDADEVDRHASAAPRTVLIARRLVITKEHLRGPAAAHLTWRRCW